MIVAYASMTGNIKRFVSHLDFETVQIKRGTVINRPFVLITYTTGRGQTPAEVEDFLDKHLNKRNMVAVVGSGNRNWGKDFCKSARTIAEQYNIPLLHTFELQGYPSDVDIVTSKIHELEKG